MTTIIRLFAFILISATQGLLHTSQACTRVVYKGPNGTIITARSMDWKDDIDANLWVFPRGMKRNGEVGPNSMAWTSTYGSVIATAWDISTVDGMNEKGLVANMLWLVESQYPKFDKNGNRKGIAVSLWAQYVLDNFATVAEAVAALQSEPFDVVTDYIPGTKKLTTVHLSLSDASGDNAIFEYIGGKLVIHHDPDYIVMTNSPTYDEQLAILKYWKDVPGTIHLPGTNRATDRYVRAHYYIQAIPQTDNTQVALASVLSVIRNCSVPYGISSPQQPEISNTKWRSICDHKNLTYYFETALTPNTLWVDLRKFNLSEKGQVRKLTLAGGEIYAGETSAKFVRSAPFQFLGL